MFLDRPYVGSMVQFSCSLVFPNEPVRKVRWVLISLKGRMRKCKVRGNDIFKVTREVTMS